ncbi:ABC transporter ATP-binding protein [Geovibrio ferrireducens]|uniref:ABC transporter ATP-binding protein n=1 Tax=Geovibrio ferrireducens TaxID=46201 RepID=UPI00224500B4|nr:ABC transporter ATP-binding protein [Geovibrio ferrireducens]
MVLAKLVDIRKKYMLEGLELEVLKGISLEIEKGEFIAVTGPSGSGKTTLMNILGLLDSPTSGQYFLNGEDVSGLNDDELSHIRNRTVGFVFQSFHLIPHANVLENVLLPAYYGGESMKIMEKRALELLDRIGLADKRKNRPNQLSGGQQQRVAIARALIADPQIILADEPTGQLDSETSASIMELITELNRSGKNIIVVTHDPATSAYAKREIRVLDGMIG